MKKKFGTAVLLLTISALFAQEPPASTAAKKPYYINTKDSIINVSLNLVGDLMCHKPQSTNAKKTDGTYDFTKSFEYISPYISNADLTIGNLETTFAGTKLPYAGYPAFNSPDEYATALKEAGFDLLVTANNHSMDTGEEGLLRTLDVLKKNKLGYCGTYASQADHDSVRIIDIRGLKLGIVNYTYGTNGAYPKTEHKYMLNVIDSATIVNEIKQLKTKKVDVILVFYHFGNENIAEPVQAQKDAVKYAWQAGAHLIIGAHPHVVGPAIWLPPYRPNEDSCFVAYSLGNFISNQYWRYTDAGLILKLHLQKSFLSNKIKISQAEYLPTWVYRAENASMKQHIVLPAAMYGQDNSLPFFIDAGMQKKMEEAYNDTRTIFTKYTNNINITPLLLKTEAGK